jgi:hypothetical protein
MRRKNRKIRAVQDIATSGLSLGAMATAGTALGGTNLVGGLTQGYGSMMPAVGSIYGAGMAIDAARMLQPRARKRKRR